MKDMWRRTVSAFRLKPPPHIEDTMTDIQYRILSEDITNVFYANDRINAEGSLDSLEYWERVDTIEDIIQRFKDKQALTKSIFL